MSGQPVDQAVLAEAFATFERSAFRCERQPTYSVPEEAGSVDRFLAGEEHDPTEEAYFADGFEMFTRLTRDGRTLERVRVHDDPPTPYQRWLQWLHRWNALAGERIHYLGRARALRAGLVPSTGSADDFWLFDDAVVIVMRFDPTGRLVMLHRADDNEAVAAASAWKRAALDQVGRMETSNP